MDQIAGDLSQETKTLPRRFSEIQLISRALNNGISVRPSRQQNTHTIVNLEHANPAVIESFIKPFFTHLQSQYYAGWAAIYNKAQEKSINANSALALVSYSSPSSDFITYETNQFMLSGSPFVVNPQTRQKAHMTYRNAALISIMFAITSALLTFLMLRYRDIIIRYIQS